MRESRSEIRKRREQAKTHRAKVFRKKQLLLNFVLTLRKMEYKLDLITHHVGQQ